MAILGRETCVSEFDIFATFNRREKRVVWCNGSRRLGAALTLLSRYLGPCIGNRCPGRSEVSLVMS